MSMCPTYHLNCTSFVTNWLLCFECLNVDTEEYKNAKMSLVCRLTAYLMLEVCSRFYFKVHSFKYNSGCVTHGGNDICSEVDNNNAVDLM